MNREVATHGKKMGLANFNFLALVLKGYRRRDYLSSKNVSFVHLSEKVERMKPIRFRANFSIKINIFKREQKFSYF